MRALENLKMRVAWFVAANRGDVLRAGGKADHQVHFGTHDDVIGNTVTVTLIHMAHALV